MTPVSFSFPRRPLALLALVGILCLTACNNTRPTSAFYNRGTPESLLDVSSELVNLSIAGRSEIKDLGRWVANDQPSRAELFCDPAAPNCKDAKRTLQTKGIETNVTPSANNTVTLIYERILARDCNQRYIDTGFSMYGDAPPAFGCSIAANTVQHVSDKREFINPSLSDDPSAVSAVRTYHDAMSPKQQPAQQQSYGVGNSTVSSSGSGGQ